MIGNTTMAKELAPYVIFQSPEIYSNANCTDRTDNDVAGPGVRFSFSRDMLFL